MVPHPIEDLLESQLSEAVDAQGLRRLLDGVELPLVGRVSMDMLCVDLSECPGAGVGSPVVLWGEGLPVERIAEITKVSAYELITRLTSRVAMKYID